LRLKQIDLYRLQIPFSMPIRHNLANHTFSENLLIKVTTDAGVTGYGEGIARHYVTGETMDSSLRFLGDYLVARVRDLISCSPEKVVEVLGGLVTAERRAEAPAACCALEIAILDAAGKSCGQPVASFLGGVDQPLVYSAVIPMLSQLSFQSVIQLVRDLEMDFVKIKMGGDQDLEFLAQARKILGERANIRVDANGAWSAEEAEHRILAMTAYGISAVEQPVKKEDLQGLRRVTKLSPVPIIADESLCSERDAQRLAEMGACQIFNLRLSKCGGILAAARIREIGRRKGIASQLGCQVGETGILSAAGRHFAASCPELVYLEGSYGAHLLKDDIVNDSVTFGRGGTAQLWEAPGLGVTVNEEALQRVVLMHREIHF
jgi:L-alanine-DL-glutamate epimerase-like enolase superfamily enzyme